MAGTVAVVAMGTEPGVLAREVVVPRNHLRGRSTEVEAARQALTGPERLVTLVGPGGIGKTRVALEVASRRRADGVPVHTVALEALDADAARRQIVEAAVAADEPGTAPLILLDTFEHVLEAVPILDTVLRSTRATLLVTSRTRLGLDGERVVALGPLDPAEARALLVERAVTAGATENDLPEAVTAQICEEVGYQPLAVELAAARAATIGAAAVAEQLASGRRGAYLATLSGSPAATGRGGSVASTVEWTEMLLSSAAARLLHRLAVVPGSFGPEVAAALGDDVDAPSDLLAELAGLHLVERVEDEGGTDPAGPSGRFRLHRAVAEHGLDTLARRGEDRAARSVHLAHARRLAASIAAGVPGDDEARWHLTARRERSTLDALLAHLAADGPPDEGLEVAVGLAPHWLQAGPIDQARRWLAVFLGPAADADPGLVAQGRAWAAALAVEVGEHDHLPAHERAVADLRAITEAPTLLLHLDLLTHSRLQTGDLPGASALSEECLALATDIGSGIDVAKTLNRRANTARQAGDDRRAAELALRLLERAEEHGRTAWAAWAHTVLADLKARAGTTEPAIAALCESHDRSLHAGLLRPAMWTAITTGGVLSLGPDRAGAGRQFRLGLRMATEIGHHSAAVCATMGIAGLGSASGLHEQAAGLHRSLERHLAPLEGGVVPPRFLSAYLAGRSRSYAEAPPGAEAVLRPWVEVVLLAAEVADAVTRATRARAALPRSPAAVGGDAGVLSSREAEVLAELARGGTNREIALRLFISPKTVMHHTSSIYRKLQVSGRAGAVARAYRDGLLTDR